MYYLLVASLAALAAGLALLLVLGWGAAAFLGSLVPLLQGLAVIVVVVFALVIIYLAIKALLHHKKHC